MTEFTSSSTPTADPRDLQSGQEVGGNIACQGQKEHCYSWTRSRLLPTPPRQERAVSLQSGLHDDEGSGSVGAFPASVTPGYSC